MTSVYIHIPFCASRCIYCDFYLELAKYGGQEAFQTALLQELTLRWQALADSGLLQPISTLYCGGGTPSLLAAPFYKELFKLLSKLAGVHQSAECTLEVNPCDIASPMEMYRVAGFNRVSVGLQSLQDEELRRLSRRHNAEEAMATVYALQKAGFDNLSIDLMYTIPGQTLTSWKDTLDKAITLPVEHISLYGLQLEAGTALDTLHQAALPRYALPDDSFSADAYALAQQVLAQAGFVHYEISNWARPGKESRHNLAYWKNSNYWAFGPAAHGYVHPVRYANKADLKSYCQNPLAAEFSFVSERERAENFFIFGLRQPQGVSWRAFHTQTMDPSLQTSFKTIVNQQLAKGLLQQEADRLFLKPEHLPLANSLLAAFLG